MKIEIDESLNDQFAANRHVSIPVLVTCNPVFVDQVIKDLREIGIEVPENEMNQFGAIAIQLNGQIIDKVLTIKGILSIEQDHEVRVQKPDDSGSATIGHFDETE